MTPSLPYLESQVDLHSIFPSTQVGKDLPHVEILKFSNARIANLYFNVQIDYEDFLTKAFCQIRVGMAREKLHE